MATNNQDELTALIAQKVAQKKAVMAFTGDNSPDQALKDILALNLVEEMAARFAPEIPKIPAVSAPKKSVELPQFVEASPGNVSSGLPLPGRIKRPNNPANPFSKKSGGIELP